MTETRLETASSPSGRQLRPITQTEFSRYQEMIFDHAGIYLPPVKKMLLSGRLSKRIKQLELGTFGDYLDRVRADKSGEEMIIMLDAVTTNETHFFREPRHFEFLERVAYPVWRQQAADGKRQRALRFWSAACSSGEEPYSLSMSLQENFPAQSGWNLDILASDISRSVLDKAKSGIWPIKRAADIPEPLLKQYMLRGTGSQAGKMKATAEAGQIIRYDRINLNERRYPVNKGLDAIFCRNVLIYFNKESRAKVVDKLLDLLAPDGYLFLGHAESLSGMNDRVRSLAPAIYTLKENQAVARL